MKRLFTKLTFLFLLPILFALTNCKRSITTKIHTESFDNLRAITAIDEKYTLIDGSGKEIMTFPDSTYPSFGFSVLINHTPLNGKLIPFYDENDKVSYIDKYGKKIPLNFDVEHIQPFYNGFASFRKNKLCGYIDTLFQIKIEPRFAYARDFSYNRAFVHDTVEYQWGVIDTQGKQITPFIFDSMFESFSPDGVQTVSVNKKYGVIDTNGTFIAEPQYDYMDTYKEGWALVEHQDSVFYIDTKGKKVLNIQADHAGSFYEGVARINTGGERSSVTLGVTEGLWGAINKKGEIIVTPKYSFLGDFNSGVSPFKLNDKYGIIDVNGNILIDPIYLYITTFSHQRATVYNEDFCGVINQKGEIILRLKHAYISEYILLD